LLPAVLALVSLALAAYCLLWAISASSLAFTECNGTYSLAASEFRCQRPIILTFAFYAFGAIGFVLAVVAVIRKAVK